jgi:hypothetical protein
MWKLGLNGNAVPGCRPTQSRCLNQAIRNGQRFGQNLERFKIVGMCSLKNHGERRVFVLLGSDPSAFLRDGAFHQ